MESINRLELKVTNKIDEEMNSNSSKPSKIQLEEAEEKKIDLEKEIEYLKKENEKGIL